MRTAESAWNAMHITMARLLNRVGWYGLVGIACILLGALLFGLASQNSDHTDMPTPLMPVQNEADAPPNAAATNISHQQPSLPKYSDAPELLRAIQQALQANNLSWPNASYQYTPHSAEALATLEIKTSLKGAYPQIKKALTRLLQQQPAMALREFTLERGSVDANEVEARIQLTVFLSDGWSTPGVRP